MIAMMMVAMIFTGCDSANNNNGNESANTSNNKKKKVEKTSKTEKSEQVGTSQATPAAGSVWSYTQHLFLKTGNLDVKTYFVFKSSNEVLWLYGTPKEHMFPMGYGNFDPATKKMSFSSTYPLHKKIAAYYGHSDPIVFDFDASAMTAKLNTDGPDWQGTSDGNWILKSFYNDGLSFSLTKENYTMNVKEDLVGTRWLSQNEYGDTYFTFKAWNEVVVEEMEENGLEKKSCLYVLLNNMVSIKLGDGEDENTIGIYYGDNEMTLCQDGLGIENYGGGCATLRRVN